ncbi:pentapeptide repeat-containing protein [Rhodobacteraceae bacterium M382]|nr:pentapeptide repeat-containing protein [Rhodobacteraceae bacterium M382]
MKETAGKQAPGLDEALRALNGEVTDWELFLSSYPDTSAVFAGADLSEADLSERNLSGLDLTGTDLFEARLSSANLKHAKMDHAELSGADLSHAGLYKARLTDATLTAANLQNADLTEADLSGADLRGANFVGADLTGADLRDANLTDADLRNTCLKNANISRASLCTARVEGAKVTGIVYGNLKEMSGRYLGIRGIDSVYGNALFVRDARDQDYIDTLEASISNMPAGFAKSVEQTLFKAWGLFDHGRSLLKVGAYALFLATLYGIIYSFDMWLGWGMMDYSNSAQSWFTPFYVSLVTYTTLGYGDVTAENVYGEILVISEVVLGYFTLGLLLSIIANTIARRS